jgi:hypothetical protein
MSPPARAPDGQASVEWIGLLLLVTALFGLGAAMAQAGFLGRHVTRQVARALCVVRSGDCERDREPCAVSSARDAGSVTFNLGIVRIGHGDEALVQENSDGTVSITQADERTLGLEGGWGVSGRLDVGGVDLAVSAQATASALGRLQGGRTWVVGSRAEAEDLLHRLDAGGTPRAPDIDYGRRTLDFGTDARVGADGPIALDAAHGNLRFGTKAGARLDHRTGHRTVTVDASAAAGASGAGGVLGLSASRGGEIYSVDFDAAGRPVDLQVLAVGPYAGSGDLPDVVQPDAGLLAAGAADGRTFEVTSHLDLTDPANLGAARDLLDVVAGHGVNGWRLARPDAAQALRRRIDERGTVEARVLAVDRTSDGAALTGAFGGKVGGSATVEHTRSRLLAATSRGLDGNWLPRTDCVA